LDAIALKTAKQWRFKPATSDGLGVESKVKLTIEFRVE
jgi:TonB family protein